MSQFVHNCLPLDLIDIEDVKSVLGVMERFLAWQLWLIEDESRTMNLGQDNRTANMFGPPALVETGSLVLSQDNTC